jgi:hypothetical protein
MRRKTYAWPSYPELLSCAHLQPAVIERHFRGAWELTQKAGGESARGFMKRGEPCRDSDS